MKIEITIKWGVASKVTYTVYNSWSTDKLHEVIRKVLDLFEFDNHEKR